MLDCTAHDYWKNWCSQIVVSKLVFEIFHQQASCNNILRPSSFAWRNQTSPSDHRREQAGAKIEPSNMNNDYRRLIYTTYIYVSAQRSTLDIININPQTQEDARTSHKSSTHYSPQDRLQMMRPPLLSSVPQLPQQRESIRALALVLEL